MEITRISDQDGIIVYERKRTGKERPLKYIVVNDKTGAVIGEARRRKHAEKLARAMRKVNHAMRKA